MRYVVPNIHGDLVFGNETSNYGNGPRRSPFELDNFIYIFHSGSHLFFFVDVIV